MQPLIPWIGGKRRLLKQLVPLMPEHNTYVEVFTGAGALFFMRNQPSKIEVINDFNSDLVAMYRVIQHHLDEFVRQFRWALSSRQIFTCLQQTPPDTLTDIQRAARFYYLQKHAFGGIVDNPAFASGAGGYKPKLNLLRIEEELSEAHIRLNQVTIENKDWHELCKQYDRDNVFFYLDPPYWGTEGYGNVFNASQYELMVNFMHTCKAKVLLSINDRGDIRHLFQGFNYKPFDLKYTVGKTNTNQAKELIIANYPHPSLTPLKAPISLLA